MAFCGVSEALPENTFVTESTTRETIPFCAAGLRAAGFFFTAVLAAAGFRADAVFDLDAAVAREELRGDAAAEVLFAADVRFVPVALPLPDVDRPEVVRLDGADLDRAVVVLRDDDEDVRRLPLDEDAVFDPPRDERELVAAAFPPLRPAAAFFAELLPDDFRVDEVVERPLVAFLVDPPAVFFVVLLAERLRLVAAAPFLPAALFFADVDVREPPVDFFVVEEAFFAVEDRELDVVELFFLAPPEDERAELELFLAPPLLLEPDEEREPVDFLVVAMRIIPPKKWCVPAWATFSKMCAFNMCIKSRQRSCRSNYLFL
jgi:hypothetical protein